MNKILTTLEKIQEEHQKTVSSITGGSQSVPPTVLNNADVSLNDVKMLLQTLIDQVYNLNNYVRSQNCAPLGNTFRGSTTDAYSRAETPKTDLEMQKFYKKNQLLLMTQNNHE